MDFHAVNLVDPSFVNQLLVSSPSPFEFPCTHIGEVYSFPYSSWQLQLPAKSDDAILHGKRPTLVHAAPPPGRPKARSTPRSPGGGGSDPLSGRENLGQWRHLRRQEGRGGGQGGCRGGGGGGCCGGQRRCRRRWKLRRRVRLDGAPAGGDTRAPSSQAGIFTKASTTELLGND